MTYCVALTGDIASGKSTVAQLFSQLGIEVIYADQISKILTHKDQPSYTKIIAHFGPGILNEDHELNRSKLRQIIFTNQMERRWIEELLHPLIRQELKKRVDLSTTAYCIVEIPLLVTKKAYPYINRVLLISAPVKTQIARIMQRDRCSKQEALAILTAQPHMKLRLEQADDVFINNIGLDKLTKAVQDLNQKYLQEAKRT
jgi:dephospho-CoA kinase